VTIFTTLHPKFPGQSVPLPPDVVALIEALRLNPPAAASLPDVSPVQGRATARALGLDADDLRSVADHLSG
jgi:predicted DNA repair protein MutK